ncbi:MAG: hypothetical protein JWQ35_2018 [Bacteriovoracaceae bacterium]|nr:hypothetical protein [Bacteriovoracaceae bacterium]
MNRFHLCAVIFLVGLTSIDSAFSYGAFSEFISADGTHFRDTAANEIVLSTDVIQNIKWLNISFPLQLTLCTGAGFSSSNVKYQITKNDELLADLATAQASWSFGTSVLSFLSPVTDACSTSPAYVAAHQMISFGTLPPGVLALTSTTTIAENGKLVITNGNIVVSNDPQIKYLTHACDTAGTPSSSCTASGAVVTFLGIITHEMGHLIGVSHSMINDDNAADGINTRATMFPSVSDLADSRAGESLELDDQLARQNIYPDTNFPANTGGTIAGSVFRFPGIGQRGAHVAVFDLNLNRTITGTFTSMTGTEANPDGAFSIKGIPFDTDFALFVEPVDRSANGLSTYFSNFNQAIENALNGEVAGFLNFKIEAYPDVSIPDVRVLRDGLAAPGFSAAQKFRLTPSVPAITGIVFNLSQSFAAPNDAALASFTFNQDANITNANPLTLTLSNSFGLSLFNRSIVTLSADNGTTVTDWSAGLSPFTFSGTTSTITVDPSSFKPSDGSYTVTVKLSDSKYGNILGLRKITVTGWTANTLSGTSTTPAVSCAMQMKSESDFPFALVFLTFLLVLGIRWNYLKSFTSRASILSNPKQS